jgi:hypothetical protein
MYTVRVPNKNQYEFLDYYPEEVKLNLIALVQINRGHAVA